MQIGYKAVANLGRKSIFQVAKRHFDTGVFPWKVVMQVPTVNFKSSYHEPVSNNDIQRLNMKKLNEIDFSKIRNENLRLINECQRLGLSIEIADRLSHTSIHDCSLKHLLAPLSLFLNEHKIEIVYDKLSNRMCMDSKGKFINSADNQEAVSTILDELHDGGFLSNQEKLSFRRAFFGVFSDMADYYFNANHGLFAPDGKTVFLGCYEGVEQRAIENAYIIATHLKNGQFPILISKKGFEGPANVSLANSTLSIDGKLHSLVIDYVGGARSSKFPTEMINPILEKLQLPPYYCISIYAKAGMEQKIYHQDCGLTVFFDKEEPQYIGDFSSESISQTIILDRIKPSGFALIAKNAFSLESQNNLQKLFNRTLVVDVENEPLAANSVLVCSKDMPVAIVPNTLLPSEFCWLEKQGFRVIKTELSLRSGGGGAKCMSNIPGKKLASISTDQWVEKTRRLGLRVPSNLLINSVKELLEELSSPINKPGDNPFGGVGFGAYISRDFITYDKLRRQQINSI